MYFGSTFNTSQCTCAYSNPAGPFVHSSLREAFSTYLIAALGVVAMPRYQLTERVILGTCAYGVQPMIALGLPI